MKTVFLHGLMGSKNSFRNMEQFFDDVLVFDLPGFGQAQKPELTYDKEFFLKFLEKKITEPCVIVGHSLGAILAKEFALRHPKLVKKIVLISYPAQKSSAALLKVFAKDLWLMMYVNKTWFSRMLCHSKHFWKWLVLPFVYIFGGDYYITFRDSFFHTNHSLTSTIDETILKDDCSDLEKIAEKSVFVVGEKDRMVDLEILKDFDVHVLKGMGHDFLEREQEIVSLSDLCV